MASNNVSTVEKITDILRQSINRFRRQLEPVVSPLTRAISFVLGSFFRFSISLGVILLALGALVLEGHMAGHFGVYGSTAILMGIVGRLIIHLKVSDSA